MKTTRNSFFGILLLSSVIHFTVSTSGCGTKSGNGGTLSVRSNPLAGPSAAWLQLGFPNLFFGLLEKLVGEKSAWAAVTSFVNFKLCNQSLVFLDPDGRELSLASESGASTAALIDFSPTSQSAMGIATVVVPDGTTVGEIALRFGPSPTECGGAAYSLRFDSGAGPIDITATTSFRFPMGTPWVTRGGAQTVTLYLGGFVNKMAALGTGLNNTTIQTLGVGQVVETQQTESTTTALGLGAN